MKSGAINSPRLVDKSTGLSCWRPARFLGGECERVGNCPIEDCIATPAKPFRTFHNLSTPQTSRHGSKSTLPAKKSVTVALCAKTIPSSGKQDTIIAQCIIVAPMEV